MHVFFCSTGNPVAIKTKAKESIKLVKKNGRANPVLLLRRLHLNVLVYEDNRIGLKDISLTHYDIQCAQAKPVSIKTKHVSIEKLP